MPRRSRPQLEALHHDLLAAFREVPDPESLPAIRYAAEKAGCSRSTARRALEVGLGTGLRSIRDLLSEEKLLARSAIRKEEIADRLSEASDTARQDAIASRARAGKLIVQGQEALTQLLNGFLNSHLKRFGETL